jgi:serralysin
MTTPTDQSNLDALLNLLERNDLGRPVKRPRFRGTNRSDYYIGDSKDNVVTGKAGSDLILGKDGNDRLNGDNGNDVIFGDAGSDLLNGGNGNDTLSGAIGADQIDGGRGNDRLNGGADDDTLTGNVGNDTLVGGSGVDILTGGEGRDRFVYNGNPFANGAPTLAAQPNINVLNRPDVVTDYSIGEDQFILDQSSLRLDSLVFQKGQSAQLSNGNVLVLTDGFAAAGAAARAIANNNSITADEGVFLYFNTTLGISRLVYSTDLGDGGKISVLANLDNQRGAVGQANLANATAGDFAIG